MKVSIGDEVILKQTQEKGKVVSVINDEMVEVEVNLIRFPIFVDEIEHPYLSQFLSPKTNKKKFALTLDDFPPEPSTRKPKSNETEGINLGLLPIFSKAHGEENFIVSFNIYLFNNFNHSVKASYQMKLSNEGIVFTHNTILEPFAHFYMHHISFELLNKTPVISWKFEKEIKKEKFLSNEGTLKLKPAKIFKDIQKSIESNNPVCAYPLLEAFTANQDEILELNQIFQPKAAPSNTFKFKAKPNNHSKAEIDLHIEQLVENALGLSNFEKLQIQLNACKDAIYTALNNRQLSIIVIHGIGSGKLRAEIHQLLKSMPEVHRFTWQYSQKYGFGATEVFLKL